MAISCCGSTSSTRDLFEQLANERRIEARFKTLEAQHDVKRQIQDFVMASMSLDPGVGSLLNASA